MPTNAEGRERPTDSSLGALSAEGSWSLSGRRVMLTGGSGFLGTAVAMRLREAGAEVAALSSRDGDLCDPREAERLVRELDPELIVHAAAAVGGIGAHRERCAEFCHVNAVMLLNLAEQASRAWCDGSGQHRGRAIVNIASAAVYPEHAEVPFREESIWDGPPEPVSIGYGMAKRFGLTVLDMHRRQHGLRSVTLLPINLYGPGDHFEPQRSHVVSALVRRFCEAREAGLRRVDCWGSGAPTREFLYVDDAAQAIARAAALLAEGGEAGDALASDPLAINLGTGRETSIAELAGAVAHAAGYTGEIGWDTSKPDGHARRSLDSSRAHRLLGWAATTALDEGLTRTVAWFRSRGG